MASTALVADKRPLGRRSIRSSTSSIVGVAARDPGTHEALALCALSL
jgi:hypothetical protein